MKPEKPNAEPGRSAVRVRPQGFLKMKKIYAVCFSYSSEAYEKLSEPEKEIFKKLGKKWFVVREDGVLKREIIKRKILPSLTAVIDIEQSNVIPLLSERDYCMLRENCEKDYSTRRYAKPVIKAKIIRNREFECEKTYSIVQLIQGKMFLSKIEDLEAKINYKAKS